MSEIVRRHGGLDVVESLSVVITDAATGESVGAVVVFGDDEPDRSPATWAPGGTRAQALVAQLRAGPAGLDAALAARVAARR